MPLCKLLQMAKDTSRADNFHIFSHFLTFSRIFSHLMFLFLGVETNRETRWRQRAEQLNKYLAWMWNININGGIVLPAVVEDFSSIFQDYSRFLGCFWGFCEGFFKIISKVGDFVRFFCDYFVIIWDSLRFLEFFCGFSRIFEDSAKEFWR